MTNKRASQKKLQPTLTARRASPRQLSLNMRTDGLVVKIGGVGASQKEVARCVQRIVDENLPGDWTITELGEDSREFIIRRPVSKQNPTASQGFEFAYRLRELRDVEDCEPSLMIPNDSPEFMQREFSTRARLSRGRSSSSSGIGGETPLACSISHDWPLTMCRVQDAWSLPLPAGGKAQGEGIVVGHPDTGYTNHPELDSARVLVSRGRDFEQGDDDPRDSLSGFSPGHGTSTGSVLMSGAGTGSSISGIAPKANLVPLRVTTSVVLFSFGKLAEAIRYAANDGHHVLSISLGGPLGSRFLHRAIEDAVRRGVIIVAAAGNVWPFVVYPAAYDEVIAAAASNCQRSPWTSSASGAAVDITAPGESVWRALAETSGFSTSRSSGTSYATAITAGAAALWLAHHGRQQLIDRYGAENLAAVFKELLVTVGFERPSGWDTVNFGSGILNVEKLLRAPLPATVRAGGLRAIRATHLPRTSNQIDQILKLFPNSQPQKVTRGLAQMLGTSEAQLNVQLRDVADEVAYNAIIDQTFRSRLMDQPTAVRKRALAKANLESSAKRAGRSIAHSRPKLHVSRRLSRMMKNA